VAVQIVGLVNVTRRTNQPLQIWRLKKRRGKAALISPRRLVRLFALHSYPLQPRSRGALFLLLPPLPPEDRHAHVAGVSAAILRSYRGGRLKRASTKKYFRIRCPSPPGNGPPHFRQVIC
jgi:hypothetical protein